MKLLRTRSMISSVSILFLVTGLFIGIGLYNESQAEAATVWVGGTCDVTVSPGLQFTNQTVSWEITNNGAQDLIIDMVGLEWPADNGNLEVVSLNGDIFVGSIPKVASFAMLNDSDLTSDLSKRTIASGETRGLEFDFENKPNGNQEIYAVWAGFGEDCELDLEGNGGVSNARITGGGHQVALDSSSGDRIRVTKGFTLHCDILLSNNLEINWKGGNDWHLDKLVDDAFCRDDPNFEPDPPTSPADTFVGLDVGRLNGVDGSVACWIFEDHGEPGTADRGLIHIWEVGFDPGITDLSVSDPCGTAPGPNTVLFVPLAEITGGNLQFHEDQPHK